MGLLWDRIDRALRALRRRWRTWSASSEVVRLADQLACGLRRRPVQSVSIAGMSGLLANTMYTLLWGTLGWWDGLIRLLLGVVFAAGFTSTVSWRAVKHSSVLIRRFIR